MKENEWEEVLVNEQNFLISCCRIDNTWKIMLTNLIELWTENLSREKIIQDCEVCNTCIVYKSITQLIQHFLINIYNYFFCC